MVLPVKHNIHIRLSGERFFKVSNPSEAWERLLELEEGDRLEIKGLGTLLVGRVFQRDHINYNGDGVNANMFVWCKGVTCLDGETEQA